MRTSLSFTVAMHVALRIRFAADGEELEIPLAEQALRELRASLLHVSTAISLK
jgi:hypothetical protein